MHLLKNENNEINKKVKVRKALKMMKLMKKLKIQIKIGYFAAFERLRFSDK